MKCTKTTPIGTKVRMAGCLEAEKYGDKIWTTVSEPWQLGSKEWIVELDGYRGGFSIKCLEIVEEANDNQ
jgi:hypothetical protein